MSLSMSDVAVSVLSDKKESLAFSDLWSEVCLKMNIGNDKIKMSRFFSNISCDGRFALVENKWDLRNRRKLAEVLIDTSEIELDDEDIDEFEED
ncbi:MAG: DNA-directed RNA polymerase subunit delta [Erysipelotrichaceae bacterium]